MAALHVKIQGAGPPLVLLHGWGLHGGVWDPVAEALARRFALHRVDLPGYGRSAPIADADQPERLAEAVAAVVPADADWLGWSLGGLVALAGVARGLPIRRLILVASSPRFVREPDWPHATEPEVMARFAAGLADDFKGTILRFLALQARGSERARDEVRSLRSQVFAHGEPSPEALHAGLTLLAHSDLRPALQRGGPPTLAIFGSRDTLVPVALARVLPEMAPRLQTRIIEGAGHAPFLSHPDAFTRAVIDFLQ